MTKKMAKLKPATLSDVFVTVALYILNSLLSFYRSNVAIMK